MGLFEKLNSFSLIVHLYCDSYIVIELLNSRLVKLGINDLNIPPVELAQT